MTVDDTDQNRKMVWSEFSALLINMMDAEQAKAAFFRLTNGGDVAETCLGKLHPNMIDSIDYTVMSNEEIEALDAEPHQWKILIARNMGLVSSLEDVLRLRKAVASQVMNEQKFADPEQREKQHLRQIGKELMDELPTMSQCVNKDDFYEKVGKIIKSLT